jgi:hypothetical protein
MHDDPKKNNARSEAGKVSNPKLAGGGMAKKKVLRYSNHSINKVAREIRAAGLELRNASGTTQLATLLKVLQLRGRKGLSTPEGTALGYLRLATRIIELRETWEILTLPENVIGTDGLYHKGVARYVFVGRRKDTGSPQLDLGLEGAP